MQHNLSIGYRSIHEMLEEQGFSSTGISWNGKLEGIVEFAQDFKKWADSQGCTNHRLIILPRDLVYHGYGNFEPNNDNVHVTYLKIK